MSDTTLTTNDSTSTAWILRSHYIFQWTTSQHRLIGPFTDFESAVKWARDYDDTYPGPRWVYAWMSEAETNTAPIFTDMKPWVDIDKHSLSDEKIYVVMIWGGIPFTFVGPFPTKENACYWGAGWQNGASDNPCWEMRHLSMSSLNRPIELIDPVTAGCLPPLTE